VVDSTNLYFIDHIKGIFVSGISKDNLDKSIGDAIRRRLAFKGVPEVLMRIRYSSMATKYDKSSDGDEDKCEYFDRANRI
jgi:hypothetical protein